MLLSLSPSTPSASLLGHAHLLLILCMGTAVLCLVGVRATARGRRARAAARVCSEEGEVLAGTALRVGAHARAALLTAPGSPAAEGRVSLVGRGLVALDINPPWDPKPGSPLLVTLAHRNGPLRFYAPVKETRPAAGGQRIYVARPQWVERAQRRQYYRVAVRLPITIWRERAPADGSSLCRGVLLDLSGGGCRLGSLSPLEPSTRVFVRLPPGLLAICEMEAEVLECTQDGRADGFGYLSRCQFVGLPAQARVALARYCFLLTPAEALDPKRAGRIE